MEIKKPTVIVGSILVCVVSFVLSFLLFKCVEPTEEELNRCEQIAQTILYEGIDNVRKIDKNNVQFSIKKSIALPDLDTIFSKGITNCNNDDVEFTLNGEDYKIDVKSDKVTFIENVLNGNNKKLEISKKIEFKDINGTLTYEVTFVKGEYVLHAMMFLFILLIILTFILFSYIVYFIFSRYLNE